MTDPIHIPGWGPGIHHHIKINGTDTMTFSQLASFVHQIEPHDLPRDAVVEISKQEPDRPGERSTWSIAVSWKEDQ